MNLINCLYRVLNIQKEIKLGKFFFVYSNKLHHELVPMPANFNFEQHKVLFPPANYEFPRDIEFQDYKVYCFLFLISSIPARNGDLIDDSGFTRIKKQRIRNTFTDINYYIDYLSNTRVIEVDRRYIVGEKARGYKWHKRFDDYPMLVQNVVTRYSDDAIKFTDALQSEKYPHLFYWYNQNQLDINPLAEKYAYKIMQNKFNDATRNSWKWNHDLMRYKYPRTQYVAAIRNLGKLKFQQYEAHIDNNVHRLHSTITNLETTYRNFLTYNNQPLTSVDIVNSQPYLTCLILNPDFWKTDSNLPLNIGHIPENIKTLFLSSAELTTALENFFAKVQPPDFDDYKSIVSNGLIYNTIMDIANTTLRTESSSPINRKDTKTAMFSLLFSRNGNRAPSELIKELKDIFNNQLYPKVGELFRILKTKYSDTDFSSASDSNIKKPHAKLPVLLQAIESELILHHCCRRIWDEKQGSVPIFTIHDSIVTTLENASYIEQVMIEELTRHIGVTPKLSIEHWKEEQLDQSILSEIRQTQPQTTTE